MINSRRVLFILAVLLVLPGCRHKHDPRIGKVVPAQFVQVLSGNEFDVILVGGERIHAFLPVGTPPQAKEKVTKLINKCVSPQVVFKSRIDKGWVVDIRFRLCNGTSCSLGDESLVEWLKTNGLSWE